MAEEIFGIKIEIDGENVAYFRSEADVKIIFCQKDRGALEEVLSINGHISDAGQSLVTSIDYIGNARGTDRDMVMDPNDGSMHVRSTKDKNWDWDDWYECER
jgi:hypothetical protein